MDVTHVLDIVDSQSVGLCEGIQHSCRFVELCSMAMQSAVNVCVLAQW